MMRTITALPLIFALSFSASLNPHGAYQISQKDPEISISEVRADIEFLSSEALEGRLSLQRGADVAAQFIAAEFRKAGLKPADGNSFLQKFPLVAYRTNGGDTRLNLYRRGEMETFHFGQDVRGGFPRDVTLKAPLVFAGYGITAPEYGYDDYQGLDVAGKIVLIFDHEPQENNPRSIFNGTGHTRYANAFVKSLNARKHGAVAVLIASEPDRKHRGRFDPPLLTADRQRPRGTAPPQAFDDDARIPVLSVSDSLLARLLSVTGKTPAALQSAIDQSLKPASMPLQDSVVELRIVNTERKAGLSANVAGLIEGVDPRLKDETVLITAHYDHLGVQNGLLYPGANDNASGTAGVIELARAFERSHTRPKRTLLFIVFGSEEEGLLGSYYYAEHPLRPLRTTRAVLNLDMIGRDEAQTPETEGLIDLPKDTTDEINLVGSFYSPDLRARIIRENRRVGLVLSTKFDQDNALNVLFRCDHFPFLLQDVPAVWFFGGFHPGYHEPSDTAEKINFAKVEKVLRLTYLTARSIADEALPPRFASGPG